MRILFALDITEPELEARLTNAISWVERLGHGTLDLLYVAPDFGAAFMAGEQPEVFERELQALRDRQLERMEELSQSIPEAHRGTVQVLPAPRPAEAVVSCAATYELLMVHTHGRTGLSHLFLGSVAQRVVRLATVPTLVLRVP